ncbi:MAG: cadherin-like beta sandwich domain-containing protein, partial [Spirochaetes bacterium]|nr:cadherin-like beta sandwich domain-containing protein [Spirochaetota bacterium]
GIDSLSALTTDIGTWNTPFATGTYDYTVTVDDEDAAVVVTATATDPNATIDINCQGSSPQTIILGAMGTTTDVAVLVTAQDGTMTLTYTLHVVRPLVFGCILTIETDVGAWNTPFATGTYDYTVTVDSTNTSVVVTVTADYMDININGQGASPQTVALGPPGSTTDVDVVGTWIDGVTTLTYTLHVVRPLGDDASLSALTTDLGTWNTPFTPSTYNYTVTTGGYDTSVVVTATATDPYATININSQGASPQTIALGSMGTTTEVAVLVTAQDGTTTLTYTLYVVRPSTCPPSISDITTSPAGTWDSPFATGDYDYTVTVDDEVAAVVVTVTADPELSIVINSQGASPQTVALGPPGTTTDVSVVAVWDYTITTYTLHIVRPMGDDASLSALATDIGTWDMPFSPSTYEYTVTVDDYDTSVVVIATATDANAYININGQGESPQTIALGPAGTTTEVAVLVTAQNATTTQTYTIYFYRLL